MAGFALAGLAAAVCSGLLARASDHVDHPGVQAALMIWMVLLYVLGGLVAWSYRPGRFGPLMVVAGFSIFLSSLSWADGAVLFTIGIAFDLLPAVLFLHVFLAFPTGRLVSRLDRAIVACGYVAACGLQLVKMALDDLGPNNLLAIRSEPGAARVVQRGQLVAISVLSLVAIAVLLSRRRGRARPLRHSMALLVNSFSLGLAMLAFLFLSAAFGFVEGDPAFETIRRITFFVIGLAPVAFVAGLLNSRLRRSAVSDLFVDLPPNAPTEDLREALARALRDPTLTLAYWLPEFGSYADLQGRPIQLPSEDKGRAMTRIDRNGAPVAVLLHSPSLRDEPELLSSVTAAAGIALENLRLHAELRARIEELSGSRARVIEAEQKERQRLERNLHDGAQQRLVALSLDLGLLKEGLDAEPDVISRLDRARQEITVSLAELRDIARGIHPAVVSGHGLAVALEELAAHAPVPIRLTVDVDGRLAESIEVAAYYVVCESLANIGKHAHATSATVEVARDHRHVVVEVIDDGIGGADTERGSGIRGLADRVEALGGRLQVWTPHGGGTRVRAEIPCVS